MFSPSHIAFSWINQPALSLPIYAQQFGGARVEIAGESPYLSAKAAGISFALHPDHRVRAVFLYAQGVEDFAQYGAPLPGDLSFAASRADVRKAFGEPVLSGEAGGTEIFAIEHSFDRYEEGPYYLRFEYMPGDAAIRLATIGFCDD
jgi:hypothetical protein